MKAAFTLFVALVAVVLARPQAEVEIVRQEIDYSGTDGYKFNYELSDGTQREEAGELKNVGGNDTLVTRGSYSWVTPEGQTITITFVADEFGYRAEGDAIPK